MQEGPSFQVVLLIIGVIVIAGVLVHGFWTTRRQAKNDAPNRYKSRRDWEPSVTTDEDDDSDVEYEDVVLSPARVVKNPSSASVSDEDDIDLAKAEQSEILDFEDEDSKDTAISPTLTEHVSVTDTQDIAPEKPLYSGVVTQPKPEFTRTKFEQKEDDIPEPPSFLLRKEAEEGVSKPAQASSDELEKVTQSEPEAGESELAQDLESPEPAKPTEEVAGENEPRKELSLAEQARRLVRRRPKSLAEKIRKEPVVNKHTKNDDQMRIDFGESPKPQDSDVSSQASQAQGAASVESDEELQQDVLILNVQCLDEAMSGAALLPMLLTLGFKFGEHDIFHRHVNTNGKGPILFSLANLFKPGIFDIDNMESFSTHGVSLFMMLPIEGDPQQVFNMMHNAARKIADEFNGKILDASRVPISKQSLQHYAERIRHFERSRLSR